MSLGRRAGGDDRPQRRRVRRRDAGRRVRAGRCAAPGRAPRRADAGAARRRDAVGAAAGATTCCRACPTALSLAAENAPGSLRGRRTAPSAIAAFQAQLEAEGVACRALRTSHAFHSAMMEPVVAPFRAKLARGDALRAPTLPIVSTVTGALARRRSDATSPDYWARHLREPVRFCRRAGARCSTIRRSVLLEVGPRAHAVRAGAPARRPCRSSASPAVATLSADLPASEPRDLRGRRRRAVEPGRRRSIRPRFDRARAAPAPAPAHLSLRAPALLGRRASPRSASQRRPQPTPAVRRRPRPSWSPSCRSPAMPPPPAADTRGRSGRRAAPGRASCADLFEDVAGFDMADADADATSSSSASTP